MDSLLVLSRPADQPNSKWTPFIRSFSNRRPLKALYNIAHIHLFTDTFTQQRRCQPCQRVEEQ